MTSAQTYVTRKAAKATLRHARHGTISKARRQPLRTVTLLTVGGLLGVAVTLIVDPRRRGKRRQQAEQAAAQARRTAGGVADATAHAARRAKGTAAEATAPIRHALREDPDGRTLSDRVKSEVLRSHDLPKGDIVIDAVDGIVTLRGAVASVEQREQLVTGAAGVDGVDRVECLLHVRGEDGINGAGPAGA